MLIRHVQKYIGDTGLRTACLFAKMVIRPTQPISWSLWEIGKTPYIYTR